MRLVLDISYYSLVFPEDIDYNAVVQALTGTIITEVSGYADTRVYVPSGHTFTLTLVPNTQVKETP